MFNKIIMDGELFTISQDEMDSLFLTDSTTDRAAPVYGKIARLLKEARGFDTLSVEEIWIALLPLLLQGPSPNAECPTAQEKILTLIEQGAFDRIPEDVSIELLADLSGALAKKYMRDSVP